MVARFPVRSCAHRIGRAPTGKEAHMTVPRADARETAGVLADVVLPLFARGIIVRRQRVVGALDRLDADRRAVRRLQRLRRRYGPGPVLLRGVPGREVAFVLDADTARRVLDGSPVPFSPASWEKRRALAHFEPEAVLIAPVERRPELRRVNEDVLDTPRPVHRLHDQIAAKVDAEAAGMLGGTLSWDRFAVHWWRLVRRIVLGDAARDDDITDLLARLRADANWAFLKPRRTRLRRRFTARLQDHLDRREPGSLAALGAPAGQVPQWLFAFD